MCDWSSLRKHILEKRCPVLFNKAHSQHQTTLDDVGAAQAAPSTLTEVEVVPYAERPATVAALRRYGDNAAFHLPDRQVLARYCALCNQWTTSSSKMKQHFRLSHAEVYQEFMHDACNLCSKFNSPDSPCPHCGSRSKVPRQHPSQCTVLWQLGVLHLRGLRYGLGNELLQAHGETMSRELEAGNQGAREAKSQRTENGKGRGHLLAEEDVRNDRDRIWTSTKP